MTDKWPSYRVADDDSVYALGVMNINYVRFEATLGGVDTYRNHRTMAARVTTAK
jgi:hypothetical protein